MAEGNISRGAINTGNLMQYLALLQKQGLLTPEQSAAIYSPGENGINVDLSNLTGYTAGQSEGPGGVINSQLYGPQGNVLQDYAYQKAHNSMTGRDWAEGIGTALAPIAIGTGLGALGYGAGAAGAGEMAALGAGQVGALDAGGAALGAEGAGAITGGSGLTAAGSSLYAPAGYAAGGAASAGAAGGAPGGIAGALGGLTGGNWAQIGAGLLGTAYQSSQIGKAANTQADATRQGIAQQQAQYQQAYNDQAPYRQAGVQALGQYQGEINKPTTAADVMQDPGYQFSLDQGQQGLDRKFAASGGRISGASLKAASRFNTGQASLGYGAAYQRGQDRLNRLASLAGLGQTSTQASAQSGQNAANNISNMTTSLGNSAGAAALAQGSVWGNAGNQIAALYGRAPNQMQNQQYPQLSVYNSGGGY